MFRRWFKYIYNFLMKPDLPTTNATQACDADSLLSCGKKAIIWNREYFFKYFVMDNVLTCVTGIVVVIVCIGYVITSYFRKQSTLAWKLCRYKSHVQLIDKRNNELSKELIKTKSHLSQDEQQLVEKGSGISNILEISRLRTELEAVRNERNALLRRLQTNCQKSPQEKILDGARTVTEYFGLPSWPHKEKETQRGFLEHTDEYTDQKSKLNTVEGSSKVSDWEERAIISEYEIGGKERKQKLEGGGKVRQTYDSLVRERNGVARRLELIACEKHEITNKLLSFQKELKATQKDLEETKEILDHTKNQLENLKEEAVYAAKEKRMLQKELEMSRHEVSLLHIRLNTVTKEKDACKMQFVMTERELWQGKVNSRTATTQVAEDHRGKLQSLSALTEEETTDAQKLLMDSLEDHIARNSANRHKMADTKEVIPTHDSDYDDASVIKGNGEVEEEETKVNEGVYFKSYYERDVKVLKLNGNVSKDQIKAGTEAENVRNLSPTGSDNFFLSCNETSAELKRFQRTLKTLELLERNMDLNFMKRKSSAISQSTNTPSPLIEEQKIAETNNRNSVTDLYHTSEITNWASGYSLTSERHINTFPDLRASNLNISQDAGYSVVEGTSTVQQVGKSVCTLGSMCSVCSKESCTLNQTQTQCTGSRESCAKITFTNDRCVLPCAKCCQSAQGLCDKESARTHLGQAPAGHDLPWNSQENNVVVRPEHFTPYIFVSDSDTDHGDDPKQVEEIDNKHEEEGDIDNDDGDDDGEDDDVNVEVEEVVEGEEEEMEEEEEVIEEEEDYELSDITEEEENECYHRRLRDEEVTEEGSSISSSISECSSRIIGTEEERILRKRVSRFTKSNNRRPVSGSLAFKRFLHTCRTWSTFDHLASNKRRHVN